jgi:prevent-host-death family protein
MGYSRIDVVDDICPVSEFRADINTKLQQTKTTHRPLVLTQRGKSTAVVMDIEDYRRLVWEQELLADIRMADQQIEEGKTFTTKEARARLKKRFSNV